MYKRCEISLCIIKFKQFKMISLFQHGHVIGIYHVKHDDALHWCWFFFLHHYNVMSALCLSLSFSQDRWMWDYLCDFRQRLDRTADALSRRVREQHGRHRWGEYDGPEDRASCLLCVLVLCNTKGKKTFKKQ